MTALNFQSNEKTPHTSLPWLPLAANLNWQALVARRHERAAISGSDNDGDGLAAWQSEVGMLAKDLKHRADEFAAIADKAYRGQTKGLVEVHSAMQWAQNSTAVFLGVKFAARWSAPGAIEIADLRVNITASSFELEGFGHHSGIRKRYSVQLSLFDDVVPEQSIWSASSVGRLTATFHKVKAGKWPRLAKGKERSKHQVGAWLDMQERWADDLNKAGTSADKAKPSPETPGPEKAQKAETGSQASSGKREKGQRVHTPWRKSILRQWKRLPRRVRDVLPFALVIAGVLTFITAVYRGLSPEQRRVTMTSHDIAGRHEARMREPVAAESSIDGEQEDVSHQNRQAQEAEADGT
ncbi:unnamed protein product [Polarella glacialis]|uniref:CS domain-containing protein n=1 Tax=Polarella glacialis TaxID=89957 RepID=A0A813EM78_POLGL|nr:unnamed protein product [Polarella glacialis]